MPLDEGEGGLGERAVGLVEGHLHVCHVAMLSSGADTNKTFKVYTFGRLSGGGTPPSH